MAHPATVLVRIDGKKATLIDCSAVETAQMHRNKGHIYQPATRCTELVDGVLYVDVTVLDGSWDCPHCKKPNTAEAKECWFCETPAN